MNSLEFRSTENPDVLHVYEGPCRVGRLEKHKGVGRFIPIADLTFLTSNQLREISDKCDELGYGTPRPTVNLKLALMQMGNKLVQEHRFEPAVLPPTYDTIAPKATYVIESFTVYVNHHPEAQQVLKELGFVWPVVKGRVHGS